MAWEQYQPAATIATAAVAFLALIRPDLTRLKNWIFGRVYIHPRKTIIVGYTSLGCRVSIDGSLEALSSNFFVEKLNVEITRKRDQAKKYLNWDLWESTLMGVNQGQAMPFYPFTLKQDVPLHGLITCGEEVDSEFEKLTNNFKKAFNLFLTKNNYPKEEIKKAYDAFSTQEKDKTLEVWRHPNDQFFWQPDSYEAVIEIKTSRPEGSTQFSFYFLIDKEISEALRTNCSAIIEDICGLPVYYQRFKIPILNFKKVS